MKYTINVIGSASVKGKIFPGGKDFSQNQLKCNKKEIDQLIKDGILKEAKEAAKVISELEEVKTELVKATEALTAKDTELVKATEALTAAQVEINALKAK